MQGFKSFPDRTVLDFDRGMSAVVGPNGSGKSNISDAIRWVLGEQSSKTLRGAKMEDVVFKGTADRGPVGYAEVSLVLDNGDGTLPIDAAEVMVTRRYFRSGESEYYINREPVRLRDVHELFMDTGLGRDGYSIIGQGRIDEILAVKSGDRREIFEEAAGISKYRYRKEEAERKLELTEQNLVRIHDKIAELELTVGPLKEQAEVAKKYLVLRDELRVVECSVWIETLDKLRKSSEKARADYEITCEQLEREKAALELLSAREEELANRSQASDVEAENARRALSEAEGQLAGRRADIEIAENRIKSLSENIARVESEMKEQSNREQSIGDQIAEREAQVVECERRIAECDEKIAALERRINEALAESGEIEGRVDALTAKVSAEEAVCAQFRLETASIEAAKSETERRRGEAAEELERRKSERAEIEGELKTKQAELDEARETAESLENVISGYELRLGKRRAKLNESNEQRTKLRMDKAAAENRIKLLSDMERENEGAPRAVKMVLAESEGGRLIGIHGQLARLIKADDRYALAIETALGAALQNIVVSTEEDAKTAIDYLKRRDGGRATFLPLTAIRGRTMEERIIGEKGFLGIASDLVDCDDKYRDIVENLLGRTAVVEDMDSAIAMARKHSQRFRIVTADGQIINAGGSMTGGSSARGAGVLSRANEIERRKKELAVLDKKLTEFESSLRELEREVTAAEYESEVAKTEKQEATQTVLRVEGELSALKARLEAADSALAALSKENAAADERTAEGAKRSAELEKLIAEHETVAKQTSDELAKLRAGSGEISERRSGFADEMSSLREQRSAASAEMDGARRSIDELRHMGEQFGSDRVRREELIEGYKSEIDGENAKLDDIRADCEGIEKDCADKRAEVERVQKSRMSTEAERTANSRDMQEKNRSINALTGEKARLEQRTSEADMQEKQITDKLWESYELTPLTAASVAHPVENLQEEQRHAASLRRSINALGPVNVGAIDEWARISERYEYLTSQRDDVNKSKGELLDIISEITGEMKSIFEVEFKRINDSFAETFTELFGGGRAGLRLEDENDILNCGIAIDVRLPGKTTLAIGSLSGGERAFVAIALYFAILKVRPTPFCIVDEVDTALDEHNVARSAAYMKRLCDSTQFIAITHKRGTMEECDVLYGVTMQTPGVSKILPLSIGEVEQQLGIELK